MIVRTHPTPSDTHSFGGSAGAEDSGDEPELVEISQPSTGAQTGVSKRASGFGCDIFSLHLG